MSALRCTTLAFIALAACAPIARAPRVADETSRENRSVAGLREGPWTERWASGAVRARGRYEHDVQAGPWTYWFENGAVEMEGAFVDERRDGVWKLMHPNGALRAEGRFERGFEEGTWRSYASSGALESEGLFDLGRRTLRWTDRAPDGTVRATGLYFEGARVGAWTTRDDAGVATVTRYPFPAGVACVEEDAPVARSGFVRDGVPIGRWSSRHANGRPRLECRFTDGRPNGLAHAWREDGTLLGSGMLANGALRGRWTFEHDGAREEIDFGASRPAPSSALASDASDPPAFQVVEAWIAELCAPPQPAPIASDSSSPAIAPEIEDDAPIPARAQPWTEYELRALPMLVNLYGSGTASSDPDDWWKRPAGRPVVDAGAQAPDEKRILGRKLPVRRFRTADGGTIDLDALAGKKNVVVTILRGFGGQVCVYCTAQTKSLAQHAAEFTTEDTELVVVFPGPASGAKAFLDAYQRTFGAGVKPPYALAYDPDLELVRALGLEGNLAVPTSLVLDRSGVVRWCHVAKDLADRPSAKQLLQAVGTVRRRER